MKITISRSFSKKIQLRQFEPIDSFCGAQAEMDFPDDAFKEEELFKKTIEMQSMGLDKFCRDEVEKTLKLVAPLKDIKIDETNAKDEGRFTTETEIGQE